MARIPPTKRSKEQLLYHPDDLRVKAMHFICAKAAEGRQVDEVYYEMMGHHGKTRRNIKNRLENVERLVKGTQYIFGKPPRIEPGVTQNHISQWYQTNYESELPSVRLQREYPEEAPKSKRRNKKRKKAKTLQQCFESDEKGLHPSCQ